MLPHSAQETFQLIFPETVLLPFILNSKFWSTKQELKTDSLGKHTQALGRPPMKSYNQSYVRTVKEIVLQTFVKTSQQTCQFFTDFGYEPQTRAQTSLPNLSKDGLKDSADLPFSLQTKTNIVEPDTENTPTLVYRQLTVMVVVRLSEHQNLSLRLESQIQQRKHEICLEAISWKTTFFR